MSCLREMHLDDLFKFNTLVFDPFTEVYDLRFFIRHLAQWPELALAAVTPQGQLAGFILGKCLPATAADDLHGHVSVLTVESHYRRLGIASLLMNSFAHVMDLRNAWYLDLYLRCSNLAAYQLYSALGYCLRRVLLEYYPGDPGENAYDMRKPLAKDVQGHSLRFASKQSVHLPSEEESDDDFN